MKKLLATFITLLILFGSGCSILPNDKSAIEETLKNSITEVKNKKYTTISQVLNFNSNASTKITFSKECSDAISEINKNIELTVNEIKIEDSTATANITVKSGDLTKAILTSLDNAMMFSLINPVSGKSSSEMFNAEFIKELNQIDYSEKTGDIFLKKVNNKWELKDQNVLISLVAGKN